MAIRDAMLGARTKFKVTRVDLPVDLKVLLDGEDLYVREMTEHDSGVFECGRYVHVEGGDFRLDASRDRIRLLARTVCDAAGKREFSDDDELALAELPRQLMDAVFDQAQKVNGLGVYRRASDEELEKN